MPTTCNLAHVLTMTDPNDPETQELLPQGGSLRPTRADAQSFFGDVPWKTIGIVCVGNVMEYYDFSCVGYFVEGI